MLNQNKRGITLNLKADKGRKILFELVRKADILLENFSPGALDRLGVGWSVLHEINPRLIYASATGYGLSGPDRDNLAMDLTIQAASGVMSVTGFSDTPPVKAGPAVADFLGATTLFGGIMLALYERFNTGIGRLVEVAMIEAVYPSLASSLGLHLDSGGETPERTGNRHNGLSICPYNVYQTNDGYIAINCVTEEHWQKLLIAMDMLDLKLSPEFATHKSRSKIMNRVDKIIQSWTLPQTKAKVFEITRKHRIPSAVVRDVADIMTDAHMHNRGMLSWVQHHELGKVVLPSSPIRLHGINQPESFDSPDIGQHNNEIYGGLLGYSDNEIEQLHIDGVI